MITGSVALPKRVTHYGPRTGFLYYNLITGSVALSKHVTHYGPRTGFLYYNLITGSVALPKHATHYGPRTGFLYYNLITGSVALPKRVTHYGPQTGFLYYNLTTSSRGTLYLSPSDVLALFGWSSMDCHHYPELYFSGALWVQYTNKTMYSYVYVLFIQMYLAVVILQPKRLPIDNLIFVIKFYILFFQ
jgi:hypothetical protein